METDALRVLRDLSRYEVGAVLGEGGAGRVYRAVLTGPRGLRKPVALKVLFEESSLVHREARLGGLLRHRHLVDVYEVGVVDGVGFLAMELCHGALTDHVPLPSKAVVEVGIAVASALAYAHEELGLVHLDLKPDNLLLSADRGVKVADLGIARARGFTEDGRARGTPGYMPPEQALGGAVDARSDVFALGRTLRELASGASHQAEDTLAFDLFDDVPVTEEGVAQGEGLPQGLVAILDRCTAEVPEERYPSMAAVQEALEALVLEGEGIRQHLGYVQPPSVRDGLGNLGVDREVFVGRTAELEHVVSSLNAGESVVLGGLAGVGKSCLARRAARRWRDTQGHPAWLIDLIGVDTPSGFFSVVGRVLEAPRFGEAPLDELVALVEQKGECLLLFDNVAVVLESLVRAFARTSARLLITGRHWGENTLTVGLLPPQEAETLLVERAWLRGVDLTDDPALGPLAGELDGLPLALELAAGRLGVLSAQEVLDGLSLRLLRDGAGTLEAVLADSWSGLPPDPQRVLVSLAVFEGAFTVEAARSVLPLGSEPEALVPLLEGQWLRGDDGRLRLLHSVRAFLRASDHVELPAARRRHANWCASHGSLEARPGFDVVAYQPFLADFDRACRLSIEEGWWTTACDSYLGVVSLVTRHGPLAAGVRLGERVWHGLPPELRLRARVASGYGSLLVRVGRLDEAVLVLEEGLIAARQSDARVTEGELLRLLGTAHRRNGELETALQMLEQAIVIAGRNGDPLRALMAQNSHANILKHLGRFDEAAAAYRRCVLAAREEGGGFREGLVCGNLGHLLLDRARLAEAEEVLVRAVQLLRPAEHSSSLAVALVGLANVHVARGEDQDAVDCLREALERARTLGAASLEAEVLRNLMKVLGLRGDVAAASEVFERALQVVADDECALRGVRCLWGEVLARNGREEDALEVYEQALSGLAAGSLAWLEMRVEGIRWLVLGDAAEALERLEHLEGDVLDPSEDARVLVQAARAEVLARLGRYGDARSLLDDMVRSCVDRSTPPVLRRAMLEVARAEQGGLGHGRLRGGFG